MDPQELADAQEYGEAVLDDIEDYVRRFVRIPEHTVPAVVAWIAHTYMVRADGRLIYVTPRLGFISEKPGGGKTTATRTVTRLSRNGEAVAMPSRAGYMNLVERDQATIGLVEMDKTFPRENSRIEIQIALNTGYEPDAGSITHANRKVDVHAPVVWDGLAPVLRANGGLAPLWTRTIVVTMAALDGVTVEEYDSELHGRTTQRMRKSIKCWADMVVDQLRHIELPPIDGVETRRAQIWRVLRRIGVMAGPVWSERIEDSCKAIESGRAAEGPVLTPAQRIMADVLTVASGMERITTEDLVMGLHGIPDSPWRFLWPEPDSTATGRELARLLLPHGMVPRVDRYEGVAARGYRLADHASCVRCGSVADDVTDAQDHVTDDSVRVTDARDAVTDAPTSADPRTPAPVAMVKFSG